jgi:hypothetical protein
MSFLVQQLHRGRYLTFKAVVGDDDSEFFARLYNAFGLVWEQVGGPSRRRNRALPLTSHADAVARIDCGCAAITRHEAEEATGLFDPACWDKILDEV